MDLPLKLLLAMRQSIVPSNVFPSNISTYDADFANDTYSNFVVTNTGGFATGGFDLTQQITAIQPNFAENLDGSLKTFSAQYWVRRTNRGQVVDPPRANVCLQTRDLTQATPWTKTGTGTVAKTGTGRTGVANSCSRITLSGAQCILTHAAITLALSTRRMQIEAKRTVGTPTGRISFDGGTTYTAINFTTAMPGAGALSFCKTKTAAQTVTNPGIIIEINGTSGDEVLIDFVECLNDANTVDAIVIPEVAPVACTTVAVSATGDRAAGYTTATPASNMALFMRDQPAQVHYFEWWMMMASGEAALIASDAGLQIRARAASSSKSGAFGLLSTSDPLVTTDYHSPVINKMICGFTPTESFICLNGDAPVVGAGLALNPATTHFDEGTNGAQLLRLNGGCIKRQWGGINYASAKSVAKAFTT